MIITLETHAVATLDVLAKVLVEQAADVVVENRENAVVTSGSDIADRWFCLEVLTEVAEPDAPFGVIVRADPAPMESLRPQVLPGEGPG